MTTFFPSDFPAPNASGYSITPGESTVKTQMDSGPPLVRRITTEAPTTFSMEFDFTKEQFSRFIAWHKHRALDGSAWFFITLDSGIGMIPHEAIFRQQPRSQWIHGGAWVRVGVELLVRECPILDEGAYGILETEEPEGLFAAIDDFHTLVHTTIPAEW